MSSLSAEMSAKANARLLYEQMKWQGNEAGHQHKQEEHHGVTSTLVGHDLIMTCLLKQVKG